MQPSIIKFRVVTVPAVGTQIPNDTVPAVITACAGPGNEIVPTGVDFYTELNSVYPSTTGVRHRIGYCFTPVSRIDSIADVL